MNGDALGLCTVRGVCVCVCACVCVSVRFGVLLLSPPAREHEVLI